MNKGTQTSAIQTINIEGRRWFQKSFGNTYFSATARINGQRVAEIEHAYGYGEQYMHEIVKKMQAQGLLPENTERKALTWYLRDLCSAQGGFSYSVCDVARKRDL